jgi:hypothetical protein
MIDVASLQMFLVCKETLEFQKSTYKKAIFEFSLETRLVCTDSLTMLCAYFRKRQGRKTFNLN